MSDQHVIQRSKGCGYLVTLVGKIVFNMCRYTIPMDVLPLPSTPTDVGGEGDKKQ